MKEDFDSICPNCGAAISPNERICKSCGYVIGRVSILWTTVFFLIGLPLAVLSGCALIVSVSSIEQRDELGLWVIALPIGLVAGALFVILCRKMFNG